MTFFDLSCEKSSTFNEETKLFSSMTSGRIHPALIELSVA